MPATNCRPNDYLASSLFILLGFLLFFLVVLAFGMAPLSASPLVMLSPLCAAGPVVPGGLSVDWANAVDDRNASAVTAKMVLRMGSFSKDLYRRSTELARWGSIAAFSYQ
jgi:hypothetical protein